MAAEQRKVCLICLLQILIVYNAKAEDCALIMGDYAYVWDTMEPSYVQLPGLYSTTSNYFELEYDVFPSPLYDRGPMFSMGIPDNFEYYNFFKPNMSYVVTEVSYGSLLLLLKTSTENFHHELLLSEAYPNPFNLYDENWHHIRVYRSPYDLTWEIQVDGLTPSEMFVNNKTKVNLVNRPAFIGGRPGYTAYQFQGIFKNIRLNGDDIVLRGAVTNGLVEVANCRSRATKNFMMHLRESYRYVDTVRVVRGQGAV